MKMKNRVLAVLALALLMINMVPVREAEAATTTDGAYYPDINEIDFGDFSDELEIAISECELFWVSCRDGMYYYGFVDTDKHDNPYSVSSIYSEYLLSYNYLFPVSVSSLKSAGFYDKSDDNSANWTVAKSSESFLIGTNYDFTWEPTTPVLKSNNLRYPTISVNYDYIYSSSGPVAATWAAGISNLMRFVATEVDDSDDLYVKSNWEARYSEWKYNIVYRVNGELPALAGSSPTDGNMYKLYTELVLALPSRDLVTGWISSGMSPVELYFDKGQTNWHQTVYNGQDTFVKVKVTNESIPVYHSLMNGSHAFQSDIPMMDIMASADESFNGGLRGYYGLSQEMWELWKNSVYSYVLPYEIYTVLYAKEDADTMVYGNMHYSVPNWTDIDPLSKGYVFNGGVIEKPLEDITDDDKQEIQIDTTKEELAKRTEELEQLKKEYEEALKLNGESDDLFGLFSDLSDGMRSSTSSFKGIATAVGNVFAFFPEDITSVLYAGLIAMVVIAIYKALRG